MILLFLKTFREKYIINEYFFIVIVLSMLFSNRTHLSTQYNTHSLSDLLLLLLYFLYDRVVVRQNTAYRKYYFTVNNS